MFFCKTLITFWSLVLNTCLGCSKEPSHATEPYHWYGSFKYPQHMFCLSNEPRHEISNNVVRATSKASDQPAHTRSLIRTFASRLNILWLLSYWLNTICCSLAKHGTALFWVYTCQNTTLLEITCRGSFSNANSFWRHVRGTYSLKLMYSRRYNVTRL